MQTLSIHVDDIEIGERHRSLSDDACNRLASSMKEIGLKQPITVRVVDEMEIDGKAVSGVPVLVAGRHRLEAAKRLGWSHIDCIEVDDDELAAELWEIAENLHRLDLTKEQRDAHIRRYAELLEARGKDEKVIPGQVVQKSVGRPKETAAIIAEETGLSQRTIRRALNPPPPPIKLVQPAESEAEAIIREANAIVSAWNRARHAARELALEQIDEPVFDNTRAARG